MILPGMGSSPRAQQHFRSGSENNQVAGLEEKASKGRNSAQLATEVNSNEEPLIVMVGQDIDRRTRRRYLLDFSLTGQATNRKDAEFMQ